MNEKRIERICTAALPRRRVLYPARPNRLRTESEAIAKAAAKHQYWRIGQREGDYIVRLNGDPWRRMPVVR